MARKEDSSDDAPSLRPVLVVFALFLAALGAAAGTTGFANAGAHEAPAKVTSTSHVVANPVLTGHEVAAQN